MEEKKKKQDSDDGSSAKQHVVDDDDDAPKKKKKKNKKKKEKKEKKVKKHHNKKESKKKEKDKDNNNTAKSSMKVGDEVVQGRIVSSSAKDFAIVNDADEKKLADVVDTNNEKNKNGEDDVTLLLFYQYVEPMWDDDQLNQALQYVQTKGEKFGLTGRMRVAKEGLNCTLTGSYDGVRRWCAALRAYEGDYFKETEFKLTDHLPRGQLFPKLHAFLVEEIVNYGLSGEKAPSVAYTGQHLEPKEYHEKMTKENTIIIDVRNHYEAAIGQFVPPSGGAKYIDPLMRKSTEFPVWLDKPETKDMLKDKHVLMYCTGGVRCERASALLRKKIETEEDTKALNIQGVYQLQGGIDKYFKEFPEGGWWKGKNYVFDKRFSHAPAAIEQKERNNATNEEQLSEEKMGQCAACSKPWDMYRGKHRCPTCGVPSLICRDCHEKVNKRDKTIRCDLCVAQNITSKSQIRDKEKKELQEYERKHHPNLSSSKKKFSSSTQIIQKDAVDNPKQITRLYIHNMNKQSMDESTLCETLPGITHIQWIYGGRNTSSKNSKVWLGSANVEMATPDDAAYAVGQNGMQVLGRPIYVSFAEPDPKDVWPPPNTRI